MLVIPIGEESDSEILLDILPVLGVPGAVRFR